MNERGLGDQRGLLLVLQTPGCGLATAVNSDGIGGAGRAAHTPLLRGSGSAGTNEKMGTGRLRGRLREADGKVQQPQ